MKRWISPLVLALALLPAGCVVEDEEPRGGEPDVNIQQEAPERAPADDPDVTIQQQQPPAQQPQGHPENP